MKSQTHTFKHQAPIAYMAFEVTKLIKRRFEDEAKVQGLTLPQWRIIGYLSLSACEGQSALATATDTDPMTLSGVLDRLEKRGLVSRLPDPKDSRAKIVQLTAEGEALAAATRKVGLGVYEAAIAGVSAADQQRVVAALTQMRDNLTGQPADTEDLK